MPLRRVACALALMALTALLLTACGGDDGDQAAQATDATAKRATSLVASLEQTKPVTSGKLDLSVKFRAEGAKDLDDPVSITLRGPFQFADPAALPRLDLAATIEAEGKTQDVGLVLTNSGAYVRLEGTTYTLGDALFGQLRQAVATIQAQAQPQGSATSGLAQLKALGIDPTAWLRDSREVGEEEVDGTDTTHRRASIDVARLLVDVNALAGRAGALGLGAVTGTSATGLSAAQRRDIERSVSEATLDVWMANEDRTIRKLTVHVGFEVPEDVRARADGLRSGALDVALTLTDVGEDQAIVAPKDAKPLADAAGTLQQLLGSLGAAAGSSGAGASSGSSGASTDSSELAECIQKAAGDTDAIVACASDR